VALIRLSTISGIHFFPATIPAEPARAKINAGANPFLAWMEERRLSEQSVIDALKFKTHFAGQALQDISLRPTPQKMLEGLCTGRLPVTEQIIVDFCTSNNLAPRDLLKGNLAEPAPGEYVAASVTMLKGSDGANSKHLDFLTREARKYERLAASSLPENMSNDRWMGIVIDAAPRLAKKYRVRTDLRASVRGELPEEMAIGVIHHDVVRTVRLYYDHLKSREFALKNEFWDSQNDMTRFRRVKRRRQKVNAWFNAPQTKRFFEAYANAMFIRRSNVLVRAISPAAPRPELGL
jgi:hypothetical protein